MRKPTNLVERRCAAGARSGVLVLVVLSLLAAALTGCGVGTATDEEKISETATTYLRALADGDAVEACAQLTRHARGEQCEQAIKERLSRLEPNTLEKAADASMDIDVEGDRATAGLSEPEGARFLLVKLGGEWRIDSGYTIGPVALAELIGSADAERTSHHIHHNCPSSDQLAQ
jgi:hypothetical protein